MRMSADFDRNTPNRGLLRNFADQDSDFYEGIEVI